MLYDLRDSVLTMNRLIHRLCANVVLWASFVLFAAAEVALVYGLYKLLGVI